MAQPQKNVRLGDWLLEHGLVSKTQLDLALREQKRKGILLGESLEALGFLSQQTLAAFLAQKTQSEKIDLARVVPPVAVLRLVPLSVARRFTAIPISLEQDTLTVAIADPLNVLAFDTLEQTTKLRVNLVAAAESEIVGAIDRHYGSGQAVEQIMDDLLKLGPEQLSAATEQDAPMIRLVDRIITQAINSRASDVHVQPEEKILRIRLRRDGILESGILMPKEIQPALVARFKILGNMDITETRRAQGGRSNLTVGNREVGLRFSCLPTSFGESIVVRILDRGNMTLNLESLGFVPDIERQFRASLQRPYGIILVTGPTGSGKTTTLYTALSQINGVEKSIFTLEDPVEYQLPLVRQTQINEPVGLTFAEGLRTLLRQDPDVILIGETRDTETAQLMVRAALTGHFVFSTLHTNDAIGAVPRLVDLGVEPYLLAPTLIGVVGQRLVRRLCPDCRTPAPDAPEKLAALKLDLPTDLPAHLWQAHGCPECNQTGYRGRTGIHEYLYADPAVYPAISHGVNTTRLWELAREKGFKTMLEDGVIKSMRGITTLEEILRVTQ